MSDQSDSPREEGPETDARRLHEAQLERDTIRLTIAAHTRQFRKDYLAIEAERDTALRELAAARAALRIIAGEERPVDNLMSDKQIARDAIAELERGSGKK